MMARSPPNHRSSQFREHEGTLQRFTGDGMMIFFNDPCSCRIPRSTPCAWRWPCASASHHLVRVWQKRGYDLASRGNRSGLRHDRRHRRRTNLAARLCGEIKGGQILVSSRVAAGVLDELIDLEEVSGRSR
jgi:class 3 adenylate cyclase